MPYTNAPWVDATPPVGVLAIHLDDHIRQLRLDIGERLRTIVEDIDADPLVVGKVAGKRLLLPYSAAMVNGSHTVSDDRLSLNAGARAIFPVVLPPGVTIKLFEVMCLNTFGTNITATLQRMAFGAFTKFTLSTKLLSTIGGPHTITSDAIAAVVANDSTYTLEVSAPASFVIAAARITYDCPNMKVTL